MRTHKFGWVDNLIADECTECGQPRHFDPKNPYNAECRITFSELWISFAKLISQRSCDARLKVGAVIVPFDNTSVLSLGYNGPHKGTQSNFPKSLEPGKSGNIHAELNAVIKLDFNNPKDKRLFVTHSPCEGCAGIIINANIKEVIYETQYRDAAGIDLLKSFGVEVLTIKEAIEREQNI